LSFKREKNGYTVTLLGNFSSEKEQVVNPSVNAVDYASGDIETAEILTLNPWGFRILVEK